MRVEGYLKSGIRKKFDAGSAFLEFDSQMRRSHLMIFLGLILAAVAGYWLAGTAVPPPASPKILSQGNEKLKSVVVYEPTTKFRQEDRRQLPSIRRDDEAIAAGALVGQRSLVFTDQAALEAFLKKAGNQVKLLNRLDALHAIHVSFSNPEDFAALLDGSEKLSLIYPVDVPPPDDGSSQPGAVALGAGLLNWLGITSDNSAWGSGVTIAILDTGVTSHPAFSASISEINLVNLPTDRSKQNGHGTAVASMIIGKGDLTPGVSPGATIISIRVADDRGASDSFLLAKGIVAAADRGAQLINISLGSMGDSAIVRNATDYAAKKGAMIIAAAGNNGQNRVSYPAANPGVIAVGAVDADDSHLDFSNTGQQVAISAPGFGINAAWTGSTAISVNGTSFSSPIVTGSIAALMSQPGAKKLTAVQAKALLFSYLNDSGAAGFDTALGGGTPDIGRALNGKKPGIYDAAIASQRILPPDRASPYGKVEILIQNRGTEPLINTRVQISTPGGQVKSNITRLAPNAVQTVQVPIPQPAKGNISLQYASEVWISGGKMDIKPSNNRRKETYAPIIRR